jgi:hypothetical protein
VIVESESTERPPRTGSSKRLCVGRPRPVIASAGTTGTKASTPRRPARCVPPRQPRRRRPEYSGTPGRDASQRSGVNVPRDQDSEWPWIRRARGPRRGERCDDHGGCRPRRPVGWRWWLTGSRPRRSYRTRLRAHVRRSPQRGLLVRSRLGPEDRRRGHIHASPAAARTGRGCARRRVGAWPAVRMMGLSWRSRVAAASGRAGRCAALAWPDEWLDHSAAEPSAQERRGPAAG